MLTHFPGLNRLKHRSSVAIFGCCSGDYNCLLRNFTRRKKRTGARTIFRRNRWPDLIFAILPPLVGFSIYFCLIHSMRHFATMRAMLADTISKLQITRTTVLFSAMCWAVGLVVLAQQSSNVGVEPALLQVIFIGLGCTYCATHDVG